MKAQRKPSPFPDVQATAFRTRLLAWYGDHSRDLPWRQLGGKKLRDPYPVWVSEIMLQQTRVAAVIAHYREFLRRFPTVEKLAAAREASVLAAWSGLGYYRRARMLHAAAKVVVRELGAKFPTTCEGWRELPGIGRYTAAAIASIAFGEPVAVVDGNVERVLQRMSGVRLTGAELWETAERLLDRERPGDFNQAMMELGATVCTPKAPACLTCPVVETCFTRGELAGAPRAARQKKREIHYVLHLRTLELRTLNSRTNGGCQSEVFLVQRAHDARLMARMWELPEVDGPVVGAGKQRVPPLRSAQRRNDKVRNGKVRNDKINGRMTGPLFTVTHSITVTDYTVQVWRSSAPPEILGEWVSVERLDRVALTGLARKILRKAAVIPGNSGHGITNSIPVKPDRSARGAAPPRID